MNLIVRLTQSILWMVIWGSMFLVTPILFIRWILTGKSTDDCISFLLNMLDSIEKYEVRK